MTKATKNHLLFAVAGVFALAAVGCVSEDSTPAAPTRDAAFVGYSNPDTKQTTCGNCHVDVQGEWAQTKHASAWAGLQASGHADASCYKCHATNGLTNGTGDSSGIFTVSADAQRFYQDVQCESCHGPGAGHISAPGESQPLPSMLMPADYSDGCTACHNGARQPFAEQLAASRHGMMPNWEGGLTPPTNAACQVNCHNGFGAMNIFAPRPRYKDGAKVVANTTTDPAQSLMCSVCHEPHDAVDNPAQLRMTLSATSSSDSVRHICGKCHSRSAQPTSWTSTRGAHSAQFAVLMGTAGWRPAAFGDFTGPARHGTMEGTCAVCHMSTSELTTGGAFAVQNTGHTFTVLPCLDPAALTTGGVDTSAACTPARESFAACATSNCHGSEASARHAMDLLQTEITNYVNVLWQDNQNGCTATGVPAGCVGSLGSLDTFDLGWLPILMKHDVTRAVGTKRFGTTGADGIETVAKGARFNATLAYSYLGHGDGSRGVHNPGYMRALMQNTIALMRTTYATTDTLAGVPPALAPAISRAASQLRTR